MAVRPGYRGVFTGSAPGGTNVSVGLPAATAVGDLLVVFGSADYGPASNVKGAPSSGGVDQWQVRWVGFDTETNGLHFVVATCRSTQAGARNIVFPNPSAAQADCAYAVAVIDGATVDPTTPVTVPAGTASATAGTSLTSPQATPGADQSLALWSYSLRAGPTSTIVAPIFTTTTSKVTEVSSRTYVTTAIYGGFLTSAATQAARTVAVKRSAVWAAHTIIVNGAPDAPTTPTAPKIETLTDRFPSLSTTLWPTRSPGVTFDAVRRAASVPVTMGGAPRATGSPDYTALRSAEAYSFLGSKLSFRIRRAPEGGTANAQAWMKQPDAQGVGRLGFELRAVDGAVWLDCIGQGAGYAPVGTTASVAYDEHVHRWLMVECSASGWVAWYSSVDGVTWATLRSIPAGEVPSWATTRNDLAASFEGFRTAGTSSGNVYEFIVDDVNLGPEPEPTWTVAMTGGATTFVADYSQADNEAAGYTSDSWQRQNAAGQMNDPTVPYPVPIVPAPFGRPGRAMMFRVPDTYRRYEVVPPTGYADGDYFFVGFSMLIEPDTDLVAQVGSQYQIVWQLHHAAPNYSPPLGLEVRGGGLRLAGGYGRPDPVTGASAGDLFQYDTQIMPNVPTMQWLDIVLGIGMWSKVTKIGTKAQNYGSGRVDAWVDGVRYLDGFVPRSATNYLGAGDVAYPKHGIYHANENRGATVWFADYREGTSFAAVNPAKAIAAYGDVIAEP